MSYSPGRAVRLFAQVECHSLGNRTHFEPVVGVAPCCPARVFAVRQQLANGTYDLDGHLDAILEKVLADITVRTRDTRDTPPTKQVGKEKPVGGRAVEGQHDCIR